MTRSVVLASRAWGAFATCQGDRRRFDSVRPGDVAYAKRACRRCAVREQCVKAALADKAATGTWAATTAEERVVLRRVLGAS